MGWQATLDGRALRLAEEGTTRLVAPLDEGGRYRVVVPDVAAAKEIVAAFEAVPAVGVLAGSGGLLGAKTVAENFALALHFGSGADEESGLDRDEDLKVALRLCGLPEARVAEIGREQPMNLSRPERWLLGFARCLLLPPELLVFDRAFSGLTRREADAVVALSELYGDYHPFRPVVFVDLDTHELPAIGALRGQLHVTEIREQQCLS